MKQLGHYETLEKMPQLEMDCVLYACNVSEENLGLVLRSADIFGVHTVYYYQGANTANRKRIVSVSRKSTVPVCFVDEHESLLKLRENGYRIVALEITDTSVPLRVVSFNQKTCLVIGNERHGIPDDILSIADCSCHIEMVGRRISSLNVSVATSIALYEMTQYHLNK